MANKQISKHTSFTTEDFIKYNEDQIKRDEIRAMCEPAKATEFRTRIEGRKRLLIALNKLFSNRGRRETGAFINSVNRDKI